MPNPRSDPALNAVKPARLATEQQQIEEVPALCLRVFVADDDSSSRRFFTDGLATLGARAESCTDGREALARTRAETFDLLLLDCRMPAGGALEILTSLRADALACSADAVAVATTAELAQADHQRLIAAGFSEILMKPCRLTDLQRMLTLPVRGNTAILDDGAALVTTGDATTMRALRQLLREELAVLLDDLHTLGDHHDMFSERLHRLRSSCGFCGAATLSTQTVLLQRQLTRAGDAPISVVRFRHALLATMRALDQ